MVHPSPKINIPLDEIEFHAVRSQGSGGQNINKVATAIHLRFDIHGSSLPDSVKDRLLKVRDQRISKEGIIVIKAQEYRSQDKNREEAIRRLQNLILSVAVSPKKRKPTKPTRSSRAKRLDNKSKRGQIKALRGKVTDK